MIDKPDDTAAVVDVAVDEFQAAYATDVRASSTLAIPIVNKEGVTDPDRMMSLLFIEVKMLDESQVQIFFDVGVLEKLMIIGMDFLHGAHHGKEGSDANRD